MPTKLERQHRDRAILRAYAAHEAVGEIAARHGISVRLVNLISQRAGMSHPAGRRRLPEMSEADMRLYRNIRRDYGAEQARQMMAELR